MKWLHPYRIAAAILVLFCLGHTAGGMLGESSFGLASDAVLAGMKTVHFDLNGSDCSWYGFWFGFGLTASAFLLLSAITAWQLAAVEPAAWPSVSVIAWALFAANGFNAVLSWKYFFVVPGVMSTVAAALLAAGAWMQGRREALSE